MASPAPKTPGEAITTGASATETQTSQIQLAEAQPTVCQPTPATTIEPAPTADTPPEPLLESDDLVVVSHVTIRQPIRL